MTRRPRTERFQVVPTRYRIHSVRFTQGMLPIHASEGIHADPGGAGASTHGFRAHMCGVGYHAGRTALYAACLRRTGAEREVDDDGSDRGSPESAAAGRPAPAGPAAGAGATACGTATGPRHRRPAQPAASRSQAEAVEAGPAPGVAYADLVTRIIALIIDWRDLCRIVGFVVAFIFGVIRPRGSASTLVFFFLGGLISAAISAVYFVYGWTRMRASLGQKVLIARDRERGGRRHASPRTRPSAAGCSCSARGPSPAIIPIVGFLAPAPGAGLVHLPALHRVAEPQAPGLPRRRRPNTVVVKRSA